MNTSSRHPSVAGFGSSGGGALSLALALNEAADAGLTRVEAAQIAHVAEIECKTGLGSVFAAERGGFGILTKPGAPGIGEALSYPGAREPACRLPLLRPHPDEGGAEQPRPKGEDKRARRQIRRRTRHAARGGEVHEAEPRLHRARRVRHADGSAPSSTRWTPRATRSRWRCSARSPSASWRGAGPSKPRRSSRKVPRLRVGGSRDR